MRLSLTRAEARVAYDALAQLSAYTADEMGEHLGWDDDAIEAWSTALGKLSTAVGDEPVRCRS